MSRLNVFLRLPREEKGLLLEALVLSGWYRMSVLLRPFPKIARRLGVPGQETALEEANIRQIRRIAWAVDAACRRTPWKSLCLVRALTARHMLVGRGCSCTLYMGAKRGEDGAMQAHAWTRSGPVFVTGGDGAAADYAVTSIYGTEADKEAKD